MKEEANNGRLTSLDALRGFDMMFIMGLAAVIVAACRCFPGGGECFLARQMTHVAWDGLRHHDTIFPLFLYIAGVAFPFSYAKQLAAGVPRRKTVLKVIRRGLVLFLLGLVCNHLFDLDFRHIRIYSVLGRIGFAWMFAALLTIFFNSGTRIATGVALLVGYWLLLLFFPAPDAPGAGAFSMEGNLAGYIDRTLFPDHLYRRGLYDPEGLLGVIPATVTALLGVFTGEFVRGNKLSGGNKTAWMLIAAVLLTAAGLLWSLVFPINKALWSSSFVLVAGGYSLGMFAIFYYIIDVKGWRKWTKPFVVVGVNSITIFMAWRIISFGQISEFFLGGLAGLLPAAAGTLLLAVGKFFAAYLCLRFLYAQRIFLKV